MCSGNESSEQKPELLFTRKTKCRLWLWRPWAGCAGLPDPFRLIPRPHPCLRASAGWWVHQRPPAGFLRAPLGVRQPFEECFVWAVKGGAGKLPLFSAPSVRALKTAGKGNEGILGLSGFICSPGGGGTPSPSAPHGVIFKWARALPTGHSEVSVPGEER